MKNKEGILTSILKVFLDNKEGYVSGEYLSSKLNITRQAIWKHINDLIERGYKISALPHLGYKLVSIPDKLYPEILYALLNTKFLGRKIYYYNRITSTQDLAWQLKDEEGAVIISEYQTRGRGRFARRWISSLGGLYFSFILKPTYLEIKDVAQFTILVSLSCIKAIKNTCEIQCYSKWPNDIYLNNKKLGGILCELSAEQDNIHSLIIGVGLNINNKDLPKEATSLFLSCHRRFNRIEILVNILEEIEKNYFALQKGGFTHILEEWSNLCFILGKRIKVRVIDREVEGEAEGIDKEGRLILRRDDGYKEAFLSGDVTISNT